MGASSTIRPAWTFPPGERERVMNRPAVRQTSPDTTQAEPGQMAPVLRGMDVSVLFQQAVSAGVVGLHDPRRPAAVLRTVWPVVVNPIQCMRGRRFPAHVCQESIVTGEPTLTYHDAATAIIFERRVLRIRAPFSCAAPRPKFCGRVPMTGIPMHPHAVGARVTFQAATTAGVSFAQGGARNRSVRAAITAAVPRGLAADVQRCTTDYDETAESLACQIHQFHAGMMHSTTVVSQ